MSLRVASLFPTFLLDSISSPLPAKACKSHDRIQFQGGVAVRADSGRVVAAGFGIALVPGDNKEVL